MLSAPATIPATIAGLATRVRPGRQVRTHPPSHQTIKIDQLASTASGGTAGARQTGLASSPPTQGNDFVLEMNVVTKPGTSTIAVVPCLRTVACSRW
jgi:hypothetical protein